MTMSPVNIEMSPAFIARTTDKETAMNLHPLAPAYILLNRNDDGRQVGRSIDFAEGLNRHYDGENPLMVARKRFAHDLNFDDEVFISAFMDTFAVTSITPTLSTIQLKLTGVNEEGEELEYTVTLDVRDEVIVIENA